MNKKYMCPNCKDVAGEHLIQNDENLKLTTCNKTPQKGCILLCRSCGDLLMFDDKQTLIEADVNALMKLSEDQRDMIEVAQAHIRQRGTRVRVPKPGDRVGAVFSADMKEKSVRFLGYGVYEGEFVPPSNINPALNIGEPNPRILLDNGKTVWGCECWWGPEQDIKQHIDFFDTIENVDIDEMRGQ